MAKLRRYKIWNREEPITVPTGQVFTAEEWMEQWPIFKNPRIVPVVDAGDCNGGISETLNKLRRNAEMMGAEFPDGLTDEELLQAIEDFENELNAHADFPITPEERTAAALEFMAMNSLPDEA